MSVAEHHAWLSPEAYLLGENDRADGPRVVTRDRFAHGSIVQSRRLANLTKAAYAANSGSNGPVEIPHFSKIPATIE